MAEEKKVKVTDYKCAWHALELTLRDLARALAETSVSPACVEYAVGKLTAYEKVLSLMDDFEDLHEEAV